MTTRTDQLWAPTTAPDIPGAVLFTCPAGATTIIKRVTSCNATAASATIIYGIGGFGAGARLMGILTLASNAYDDHETWWVLLPGQQLVGRSSVAGAITSSGHGTILEGTNPL